MRKLLLFLCGISAFASQSLIMTTAASATVNLPNSAPYNTLASFHVDFRIHNTTAPSGNRVIWSVGNFSLQQTPTNDFFWFDTTDTMTANISVGTASAPGGALPADFVLRVNRDTVNKWISLEFWAMDGSSYSTPIVTGITTVNTFYTGTPHVAMGGGTGAAEIGYVRWYSGATAPGNYVDVPAAPPHGTSGGDLGDWEFEGVTTDASGHSLTIPITPTPSYDTTPTFAPACLVYPQVWSTLNLATIANNSYSGIDSQTLTYAWVVNAGGLSPTLSSSTAASPTFTPSATDKGSVNLTLTVTDTSSPTPQTSSCTSGSGVVWTNTDYVVQGMSAAELSIIKPIVMFGSPKAPWKGGFDRFRRWLDFIISQEILHPSRWIPAICGGTECVGSISSVSGTTINFSGAAAQTTFACNSTDSITIPYSATPPGGSPITIYWRGTVVSCPTQNQITTSNNFATFLSSFGFTQVGTAYGHITAADTGWWQNSTTEANFYSNIMALRNGCLATQWDTYCNQFRAFADQVWTYPAFQNSGNICDGANVANVPCAFPRDRDWHGAALRVLDGQQSRWAAWKWEVNRTISTIVTSSYCGTTLLGDIRECSYLANELPVCSTLARDPSINDITQAQACEAAMATVLTGMFTTAQSANRSFLSPYQIGATWGGNAPGSTVSIANTGTGGVGVVTGIGTNFTSLPGCPAGANFWTKKTAAGPTTNAGDEGDVNGYQTATINSATQITLTTPYNESHPSGNSGRVGWQCNNLVGVAVQPFMMLLNSNAMVHFADALEAVDPTNAVLAKQRALDDWVWVANFGYIDNYTPPSGVGAGTNWQVHGLLYGRTSPPCEAAGPTNNTQCFDWALGVTSVAQNIGTNRFLAAEGMAGCAGTYSITRAVWLRNLCDTFFAGLYGYPFGGPLSDAWNSNELGIWGGSISSGGVKAKDLGFFAGWGNFLNWLAARTLQPAASTPFVTGTFNSHGLMSFH